ncbi:class I adenylate-forming enzyme family protein [Deinococcus yavapaiensis]|uniref:Acyl-CoA synthetase (AMP-forming)/AMP-acid ligase II n=1 Tax=Deinococcus yavapaiensis KR-236 TaxID=694435 RepID=A0A318S9Y1_9DEIO|nr:AMP-binding protein [Deinococcus yavapaiensis]PYE55188.1 acyl-CoA synthetase (AMP-forming)/AMP-acid ligase II [Deinococcus yavapaiensis KR-236]
MSVLAALASTGLLRSRPVSAVRQAVRVALRHGPNLYALAAWTAARFPDRTALVELDGSTSYRALVARANVLADALTARLSGNGTVGLLMRNHATFVEALLACERDGRRVVLLNTTWSAREVREACERHDVRLLLADDEFTGERREDDTPAWSTSEMRALRRDDTPRRAARRAKSGLVVLTSGSTGPPKAVERRSKSLLVLPILAHLASHLPLRMHAPTLLTLPMFHGHGLAALACALALAAPLHVFERGATEAFARVLAERDIEVLVLVPTILHRLIDVDARAPELRAIVCGSAPLRAALARRALSHFGPVLFNLYGSSEAGLVSLATPSRLLAAPDSVGRVLPGVRVSVRRRDGACAPPSELGEVVVRSPLVVSSLSGGEVATGDIGRLDTSGWLHLEGRLDDLLICGGENVSPEAVEVRVETLTYVRACAVFGLPDEEYGQVLGMLVVSAPEVPEAAVRLRSDLARLLPKALRPKEVTFVAELPRTASGKLDRARVRRLGDRV